MGSDLREGESQLFLVRLWRATGENDGQWHGKIQHIMSGSMWLFDDTQQLTEILLAWVRLPGEDGRIDPSEVEG
jgi:hypothetical protein